MLTRIRQPYEFLARWVDGKFAGASVCFIETIKDGDQVLKVSETQPEPVGDDGFPLADLLDQTALSAIEAANAAIAEASQLRSENESLAESLVAQTSEINSLKQQLAQYQATTDENGVPLSVTRLQAKAALLGAGLLAQIEAFVASADDMTQLAWREASTFDRRSLLVIGLANEFGLSDEQLDALFIAASQVRV